MMFNATFIALFALRLTDSYCPFGVFKLFCQHYVSCIVKVCFIGRRTSDYPEKNIVTDELSHNFAFSALAMSGIRTNNFSGDRH